MPSRITASFPAAHRTLPMTGLMHCRDPESLDEEQEVRTLHHDTWKHDTSTTNACAQLRQYPTVSWKLAVVCLDVTDEGLLLKA